MKKSFDSHNPFMSLLWRMLAHNSTLITARVLHERACSLN